jgi:hypothetical protein
MTPPIRRGPAAQIARCPRYRCGEPLRFVTDGRGGVVAVCDGCALNRAGRCRDCHGPLPLGRVPGRRMRCEPCATRRLARRNALRERPWSQRVANRRRMRELYHARADAEKARKRADYRWWRQIVGYATARCEACGTAWTYTKRGPVPRWCAAHRPYRVRTGARSRAA